MKTREHVESGTPRTKLLVHWLYPLLLAGACCVVMGLSARSDLVKLLELKSYDVRMRTAPRSAVHYADPRIVIIALDEDSFRRIPEPSLLWLAKYTRLLRALKAGGARVVALDVMLQRTPDDFLSAGLRDVLDRTALPSAEKSRIEGIVGAYNPRFDNEFGLAVKETRAVIDCWIDEESGRYALPHREIALFAGGENLGSVTMYLDPDGVCRQEASHWGDAENLTYPTFPFLVAARALGREAALDDGTLLKEVAFHHGYSMLINFVGPAGTFRQYSFLKVDREARKGNEQFFRENFDGKIVLVGPTDLASQDLKKTPFSGSDSLVPGVEIHASAVNTLLHRDFIRALDPALGGALLYLLILVYFFLGFKMPLPRSLVFGAALLALYLTAACLAFWRHNLWMETARPAVSVFLVMLCSYAYRYVVVERERKWLGRVLGRYVSGPVAESILKDPESLRLGGDHREISVVFSDINGFTTLSESNEPQVIMESLNEYFTLMEEVIFRNRGTLKQFVGDEIMVIFGAPGEQEDHAGRAVLTALQMRDALVRWGEERKAAGKLSFGAKFGVHSGPAIVGNVGSPHRTEYAAVGDTVNTGARIMGLNKALGTTLLVSEAVYEAAAELVEVEDMGLHSVKGKGRQLHIYSVLGPKRAR